MDKKEKAKLEKRVENAKKKYTKEYEKWYKKYGEELEKLKKRQKNDKGVKKLKNDMKEEIEALGLPDKPKKYLTMYFKFQMDYKKEHPKKFEGKSIGEGAKIIKAAYDKISEEDKEKYEKEIEREKKKYESDMEKYTKKYKDLLEKKQEIEKEYRKKIKKIFKEIASENQTLNQKSMTSKKKKRGKK